MAGVMLVFRSQWRAYWRHFTRTHHRAQFYLVMLGLLSWLFFIKLPPSLSQAARELEAGQTARMDDVLVIFSMLWLFVLVEEVNLSLTSQHLLKFPLSVGALLRVRMLSFFCSPVALLILFGSLFGLSPFFAARHTLLGSVAALMLFALVASLGMSLSHLLSIAELRRKLLVPVAIIGIALGAFLFANGRQGIRQLQAGVTFTPVHLVTSAAVAATPSAAFIPLITLLAISAPIFYLLFWSFRRSLFSQQTKRATARATGNLHRLPGKFGGLVWKEQHYFRKLLEPWLGLMLTLAVSLASLFGSPQPIVRQLVILMVFALDVSLSMNCFGIDKVTELNRYFIFPLRGKDIMLIKNLGLLVIVTAQLLLMMLTAVWRSGLVEASAELIEAAVLLLSHLAWGNIVSVHAPFKLQFYRLSSGGSPLTVLAGLVIGSFPGVMVLFLLQSNSKFAALGMALILLLAMAVYLASLNYAGRSFERRRQTISDRLS